MTKWVALTILSISFIEYYFVNELYYCLNWFVQSLFFMFGALTTLIALIMILLKYLKSAFLISVIGGIFIVSFSIYKLSILKQLKIESERLIQFAHNEKIKSGKYPSKLNCEIDNRVIYTKIDDTNFSIYFYVTNKKSGHFYNPKEGWGYMDD